jgi:hypothetical protein
MSNNKKQNKISSDEKVCYNCKHRIWAVGIGWGVRCNIDRVNGIPKIIPSLRHTCPQFEKNEH